MDFKTGLQLYSLRKEAKENFAGTIREIAEMGFDGIETACIPAHITNTEAARIIRENNLELFAAHMPVPYDAPPDENIVAMKELQCPVMVWSFKPDSFASVDSLKVLCEKINRDYEAVSDAGLNLAIHNHWWEFTAFDGQMPWKYMFENLNPEISFELDCYWIQTAGSDPVEIMAEFSGRSDMIHVKDGSCRKGEPMKALGQGSADIKGILSSASSSNIKWVIVELDSCETDMREAVKDSISYVGSLT